ncbi:MAG: glycosyltransferase [Hyphomicrobiaceae bacterium]
MAQRRKRERTGIRKGGLPIVATDVGGNREALNDGRFGLIVPPRDPTALACALRTVVSERNEWRDKATEAAQYVKDKYSVQRLAESYIALYRQAALEPSHSVVEGSG